MGRRPSRLARGSQPQGPPSFRGLRLPHSRSRLRRPGSPKELEEGPPVRRAGRPAHDFPPRLSVGHHARLPSPVPADLPGALAQFPASAAAGYALRVLFLPNRIPCGGRPGIPGSSADAHSRPTERRGRPFSSLTGRGPGASSRKRPPSAQSISSGEPGKRGGARTTALSREATTRRREAEAVASPPWNPEPCQARTRSSPRQPRPRRLTGFPTPARQPGSHPLGGTSGRTPGPPAVEP